MPELPEVETTCRALAELMGNRRIVRLVVRESRLRWPVPDSLSQDVVGRSVRRIHRRAKYILIDLGTGSLIVHLGMSGSMRQVPADTPAGRHDHIDIELDNTACLRYHDPRRFGSWHWTATPDDHFLLRSLGPEPLGDTFNADYLFERSRRRKVAVKNFIMNGSIVVGVGNIYASEALFRAGIHPRRSAGRISRSRYYKLVSSIRDTLNRAIAAGGTTLRDFVSGEGTPGYFKQQLLVYGREQDPCNNCGTPIRAITIGQRASFYCPACQR